MTRRLQRRWSAVFLAVCVACASPQSPAPSAAAPNTNSPSLPAAASAKPPSRLAVTIEPETLSCSKAVFTLVVNNPSGEWTAKQPRFRVRGGGAGTFALNVEWDGRIPAGESRHRLSATYLPGSVSTNGARIVATLTRQDGTRLMVTSPPQASPARMGHRGCAHALRSYTGSIPAKQRLPLPGNWHIMVIQSRANGDVLSQYSSRIRVAADGAIYRTRRREKRGGRIVFEENAKPDGWVRQVEEHTVAMEWPPENTAVFRVSDRGTGTFKLSMGWTIKAPTRAEFADMPYPRAPRRDQHFRTRYEFRRTP